MSATQEVIAIDLGATSGRVMRVGFDGQQLSLTEAHRFPNIPVMAHGTLYWDALRIWHEIEVGIGKAGAAQSMGLDSWGVDFALLDRDGHLLANPVHYRDLGKENTMEWLFERVPKRTIFERTGLQFMQINGLVQLAYLVQKNSPQLMTAATLLTIADLFNYWLTGSRTCEFTETTTLQMYNPRTADWDTETLGALGVDSEMLPPVVQPGTRIGEYAGIPVIAPACHDTGSAVVAVPTNTRNAAYLSSGTWGLIGMEIDEPLINDAVYDANITNEGGVEGTYRLLKNVAGMWLVEQSRQTWASRGRDYNYAAMGGMAKEATPFLSLIDPDDPLFLPQGDMPKWIQQYCQQTGQTIPADEGQILRIIYESLALKYRYVLDKLIALTGRDVERLHIIGGGSQNRLLCQMTANAIGREVIAGPVEATALGNAIVQMIANGDFANVTEAREVVSRSQNQTRYTPENAAAWQEAFQRFQNLLHDNSENA